MWIRRIFASLSFRIIGLYVLFFLATAIGFLRLMVLVLSAEIEDDVKEDVRRDFAALVEGVPETEGAALRRRVEAYIEAADPLTSLYILQDASGGPVVSNYPFSVALSPGWLHLDELKWAAANAENGWTLDFGGMPSNAHDRGYVGWSVQLADQWLFVGRSLVRIDETKRIFRRMAIIAFPLVLLFAVLGGYIFKHLTIRRIDLISEHCRTIRRRGDLTMRVPNDKPDDEYGLLIANINAMLETIDGGVRNVQEVSDDIAHDLRTPLTRIKYGLEEGLLNAAATPSQLQSVMRASLSDTDHLLETFSAILRISQLNTGLRKSRFALFDMAELTATIAEAYAPTAEENGHNLTAHCPPNPCHVFGDRDMLAQVLSNLIENAFQHAGEGLEMRLDVDCDVETVTVSIADNGCGIPEADLGKVLNKFYRGDKSRSKTGSGLGLAIVKAVADLHGGTVHVENCMPGTKFSITVPRNLSTG